MSQAISSHHEEKLQMKGKISHKEDAAHVSNTLCALGMFTHADIMVQEEAECQSLSTQAP